MGDEETHQEPMRGIPEGSQKPNNRFFLSGLRSGDYIKDVVLGRWLSCAVYLRVLPHLLPE